MASEKITAIVEEIKALTLVYDSKTGKNYAEDENGEKTEDYSSFISTSGTITGLQEDLGARYYVVYTLTDAWGNVADPFVAKLTVIESDVVVPTAFVEPTLICLSASVSKLAPSSISLGAVVSFVTNVK